MAVRTGVEVCGVTKGNGGDTKDLGALVVVLRPLVVVLRPLVVVLHVRALVVVPVVSVGYRWGRKALVAVRAAR